MKKKNLNFKILKNKKNKKNKLNNYLLRIQIRC